MRPPAWHPRLQFCQPVVHWQPRPPVLALCQARVPDCLILVVTTASLALKSDDAIGEGEQRSLEGEGEGLFASGSSGLGGGAFKVPQKATGGCRLASPTGGAAEAEAHRGGECEWLQGCRCMQTDTGQRVQKGFEVENC